MAQFSRPVGLHAFSKCFVLPCGLGKKLALPHAQVPEVGGPRAPSILLCKPAVSFLTSSPPCSLARLRQRPALCSGSFSGPGPAGGGSPGAWIHSSVPTGGCVTDVSPPYNTGRCLSRFWYQFPKFLLLVMSPSHVILDFFLLQRCLLLGPTSTLAKTGLITPNVCSRFIGQSTSHDYA